VDFSTHCGITPDEGHEHRDHAEPRGSAHEHEHGGGPADEIEYPLTPVESDARGNGKSTTVVEDLTLEGLLTGAPKYMNVHAAGTGELPQLACANLGGAH
jgi:hypothetical protein